MAKPAGSKLVKCKNKHDNYLLPGVERKCGTQGCRCTVRVEVARVKTTKPKTKAAKATKRAPKS